MSNFLRPHTVLILATAWLLSACAGGTGDLTGSTGGGGGGGPTVGGADPLPPSPALSGLVALAAGDGVIRADYELPGEGFESALFFGTERSTLFQNAPAFTGLTGDHVVINSGFVNDTQLLIGMAIRTTGATDWTPIGSVLRCHPTATIVYVDQNSPEPIATQNGTTPQLAYSSLANGLLRAGLLQFQGFTPNVLVAEGTYSDGEFAIAPDVHLYGGFKPGFDFADRAPRDGGTLLNDTLPQNRGRMMIDVLSGSADGVVDGLAIDGQGLVTEGIDVTDSECEIRSVTVRNMLDRGSRVRTTDLSIRRDVLIVASEFSENDNGGVNISGTVNMTFDRCRMNTNGGEGADFNDFAVAEGTTGFVRIVGCQFFGNGTEGVDMDLAPPAFAPQAPGGVFDIVIEGCTFERNSLDGLLIDQDYELWPAWFARIRVRDCLARANGEAGVHFDADNPADYVIDRLRSTCNKTEGLLITSETDAGIISVSSSYFAGNQTQGIRTTLGNKMILATHCIFAGNQLGGFIGDIPPTVPGFTEGSATSCIAWRQPNPWSNVRVTASFEDDAVNPFENIPNGFGVATAHLNGALSLLAGIGINPADTVELADDGLARRAINALGTEVIVDPAPGPTEFFAPDTVTVFPSDSIEEDFRLVANSAAVGVGLAAPGAAPADPGPFGMPTGGLPGQYDPFAARPMRLLATAPTIVAGVSTSDAITLTFDRDLNAQTMSFVRCVGPSGVIAAAVTSSSNTINISPPAQGWTGAFVIELNIGLSASDGTPFGGGMTVPIHLR